MDFIFAIVLLLLALGGVVVRKTYNYLPLHELKRQAERHDPLASRLYGAAAYGHDLQILLWLFIALTSAGGLILLARVAPAWLGLIAVAGLLWIAFAWLPSSRVTKLGAGLTGLVTPLIVRLLGWLHPLLDRPADLVQRRVSSTEHTGLYEREDVLKLVERQQAQSDSRITAEELLIIRNALSFSDRAVGDILIPRKKVKTVLADDTIGPILIDELHKSGQDFVLVRDKKGGMVVGSLAFNKLGIDSTGKVRDHMDETVYYLHENDSLAQALHAFFTTNHPLFVVVNSFEEYVGIVTVENVLEQLLGHVPGEDFDQYSDVSAVAARHHMSEKIEESTETESLAETKASNDSETAADSDSEQKE